MRKIAVIGLGYVGLPLAAAFARKFPGTLGFDIDADKIGRLRRGEAGPDLSLDEAQRRALELTGDPARLRAADFYVVTVPTPIDDQRRPDLRALEAASGTVGDALSRGDVVVFESTVYPGVTEEVCAPILAQRSGLRAGTDFHVAYSPERINPGDAEHSLESVVKVIAAQDGATLEVLEECYGAVVEAGVYRATSIQVAEAAKVIENVQRDLNIALMNELAIVFDRIGLDTQEVLDAAASKWNFHRFHPGLVGGHCIGVDPYYLTTKAESVGIHPQIILAGRRINDGMGQFVAAKTVKLLIQARRQVSGARVAVLGFAFKPNVADIRNSRVPDIARELRDYGVSVLAHDPLVEPLDVADEYGLDLVPREALSELDAVVLAMPHTCLLETAAELVQPGGAPVLVDVMSGIGPERAGPNVLYWRL